MRRSKELAACLVFVLAFAGCVTTTDDVGVERTRIDIEAIDEGIARAEDLAAAYVRIRTLLQELSAMIATPEPVEANAAIKRQDEIDTLKVKIDMLMDTAERLQAMRDEAPAPPPPP